MGTTTCSETIDYTSHSTVIQQAEQKKAYFYTHLKGQINPNFDNSALAV